MSKLPLTQIPGVGQTKAEKLQEAGYDAGFFIIATQL